MLTYAHSERRRRPLVICTALAQQDPFSKDPAAFEQMAIYIFLYNIGWQLTFWTGGYAYLAPGDDGGDDESNGGDPAKKMLSSTTTTTSTTTSSSSSSSSSPFASYFTAASMVWFARTVWHRFTSSPVLIGSYVGMFVALVPPLHDVLFGDGALRFVGSGNPHPHSSSSTSFWINARSLMGSAPLLSSVSSQVCSMLPLPCMLTCDIPMAHHNVRR